MAEATVLKDRWLSRTIDHPSLGSVHLFFSCLAAQNRVEILGGHKKD